MKTKTWTEELETEYLNTRNSMAQTLAEDNSVVFDKKKVSGIFSNFVNPERKEMLKNKLSVEKTAIEEYRSELEEKGIKPLVILPEYILKMMIKGLPFYTFKSIDNNGLVKGDLSNADKLNLTHKYWMYGLPAFLIYTVGLIILAVEFLSPEGFITFGGWVLFSLAIVSFFCGVFAVTDEDIAIKKKIKILTYTNPLLGYAYKYCYDLERKHFQESGKKVLWPNNTDQGLEDFYYNDEKVKLDLPDAPASVQQKLGLCAINNINTYIIAHENGFSVNYKSFKTALDAYNDPLVCANKVVTEDVEIETKTKKGKKKFEIQQKKVVTLVAIIDQYGNVPAEKQLVAEIKKRFPSIPEQLGLQVCPN